MSLYAGMLRAGIPMCEIDRTDLGRYLRIMAHIARDQEETQRQSRATALDSNVVELQRGTIDRFWG